MARLRQVPRPGGSRGVGILPWQFGRLVWLIAPQWVPTQNLDLDLMQVGVEISDPHPRHEVRQVSGQGRKERRSAGAPDLVTHHISNASRLIPKVGAFERVHAANHLAYGMVRCGVGLPQGQPWRGRSAQRTCGWRWSWEVSGCQSPRSRPRTPNPLGTRRCLERVHDGFEGPWLKVVESLSAIA